MNTFLNKDESLGPVCYLFWDGIWLNPHTRPTNNYLIESTKPDDSILSSILVSLVQQLSILSQENKNRRIEEKKYIWTMFVPLIQLISKESSDHSEETKKGSSSRNKTGLMHKMWILLKG